MSEEILRALMELFALVAKQADTLSSEERNFVHTFLLKQLPKEKIDEYLALFDSFCAPKKAEITKKKRVSMLDSVKTLKVCKKINKTLVNKQKVIVLVRLYEMICSTAHIDEQKQELIDTVADAFKISDLLNAQIKGYITQNIPSDSDSSSFVFISEEIEAIKKKHPASVCFENQDVQGQICLFKAADDLFFVRYEGLHSDILLNGLPLQAKTVYVFASGSSLKFKKEKPIYYSDIVSSLIKQKSKTRVLFEAQNIVYKFKSGGYGLRGVNVYEDEATLVGIMGASGAGKTTLLNALMGSLPLAEGSIKINQKDINHASEELQGVIGYVPQDDLLIEDLTVFQNLFYAAQLCFDNLNEQAIEEKVQQTLHALGLAEIAHLKVGSPLNKTISGGQRKRLNIALELIREPALLFLDEPTSGLSSRDSENVIDLLRELSLKGKLIFVVIHQPSSDIYKMFDKICILDVGGYQIYYGNPTEAVSYFKTIDHQIDSHVSECPTCGNVNPEIIFNIIESKVVDEYGNLTDTRKVSPRQWKSYFDQHILIDKPEDTNDKFPQLLFLPKKWKQAKIFTKRDFLSKISNLQYILINLIEAPLLAFFLAFIIRYLPDPDQPAYLFRENSNIPSYIFVGIVVSMFIGLTVSAEEIFRDRKILKREKFLNLSRNSYLLSKVFLLFILSAIQAACFVWIGNSILEIKGMFFSFWMVLFSVFCFSNMLGLNISSAFNSAVTIYIIIPILIIPQMILGGAMFPYEHLNKWIGGGYDVPKIAEVIPSRWAYEAMMVEQFTNNAWGKTFYDIDQKISASDYKSNYWLNQLEEDLSFCKRNINSQIDSVQKMNQQKLEKLLNELHCEARNNSNIELDAIQTLQNKELSADLVSKLRVQLALLSASYQGIYKTSTRQKETYIQNKLSQDKEAFTSLRDQNFNESVQDLVKKSSAKFVFLDKGNQLKKIIDPIYSLPDVKQKFSMFSYPLFSPQKYLLGKKLSTFWFNVIVIWFYILILYVCLYYEWFKKLLSLPSSFR